MNKHAIYHITDVPYAYAKDTNTLCVRIKTAKNDINRCILHYKDRYDWVNPFKAKDMKVVLSTKLFDFYETEISVYRDRYRYYFELIDKDGNRAFLDDRGLRDYEVDKKEITSFQYAYIAPDDVYKESSWLQESVVYQIFVDRFYNGDKSNDPEGTLEWGSNVTPTSMFGGDLKGIIQKLDYIKELGVNLIYLTPIFKSSSNHKYNTADYYDIDSQFGTIDDAKELVSQCHKRKMRIVFDAVFNHSGSDFFAFQDLLKNQQNSKYKDWYLTDGYPVDTEKINYYTFAVGISDMPKFNTENKEVNDYLLKVAGYWINEVGIDGWRLDVCDEVSHRFWQLFRKEIKSKNSNAVAIGEIMHEASSFLKGDQLDSIMNYPFKNAVIDFFAKRIIDADRFNDILNNSRTSYMDSICRQMWNLIGSHDTSRFLTECNDKVERMKLAIAFQFSYIGVPYIYYGDEVGINGGEEPLSRGCMIWDKDKQNHELLNLYKTMINIRKQNKELVYGSYNSLYAKDNVLVFERAYNGSKVIIAINNNYEETDVSVPAKGKYKNLINNKITKIDGDIKLSSMDFLILKVC